ncbi:unnamed protein product [Taenia asiatica]|uniref:Mucin-5AC n=1 Tax=Taenia asiatica TaxID=60517 RepID=A0A0R3VT27_TAEAS|nr:unnamed protein product [Taenia asiatica]
MKALLLATLMLTLVCLAFCIPATARNGRSTQLPSRNRGVKISGDSEKATAKSALQNPGGEPVGDVTESGSNSTISNVAEVIRRSRRVEEKSRPRGKRRIEGTIIPTATTTTITTAVTPQVAESSKTPESDFVFENDKAIQQGNEEELVSETTEPLEIEDPKNVTTENAVTTNNVDTKERTSETMPVTTKKQDSERNVLKPSYVHECHRHWPYFNDYHQIPPEYSMPQMEVPPHGPPVTSWDFNDPYNFYPSSQLEGRLPWSPFQEQPYETPYYSMWPEEEQFNEMEPYWWDNEMSTNEGRCCSKKKTKAATTTTTSTTTTVATTTPSPVVTETTAATTTTPVPTTTAATSKPTIAAPIAKSNSTWLGIEDLLEAYKSDLMNNADASSRKQLSKMFHEIIQNYEPLLNDTVNKKME